LGDLVRHTAPHLVTLHVLGYFTLLADGAERSLRPMSARLVRRLLVARSSCVSEEELMECFWPSLDPHAARNNLHVTVHHARRAVGTGRLVRGEGSYRLVLSPDDRIDADDFERAGAAALAASGQARRHALADALALWTGEPLAEDRYADWAGDYRENLRNVRRTIVLELGSAVRQAGRPGDAVPILRSWTVDAHGDEAAARELMLALAASGRRDEALRTFEALRTTLQQTWATDVSSATRRIATAIGAGSERPVAADWAASAAG
jgi:DNA-binding SARP family transcriptional activator